MIEFQIEKVKNLKESAGTDPTLLEHNTRFLFRELCDVVLELLAKEEDREMASFLSKNRLKAPNKK